MEIEIVPPGYHKRNAAKVAIRNFKAHFLSILAGVADDFPLQLWDQLLPQAEVTINLLRQPNATPTISAYAHMNGPFNYNKIPLTLMVARSKYTRRPTKVALGPITPLMASTLQRHLSNTALTSAKSKPQTTNDSATQFNSRTRASPIRHYPP